MTVEDVRSVAMALPRTTEALVRGRVKFRVGSIVYVAFSRDETLMGFAFPKDERDWLVGTDPRSSSCPARPTCASTGSWCGSRRSTSPRCAKLVIDAWSIVVPKRVSAPYRE